MRRGTSAAEMSAAVTTHAQEVARRLLVSRIALKLTQARLCEATGISPQAWNNAQRGAARIGVDLAIRLCDETGLTLDWIYRGIRRGLPDGILEEIARLDRMSLEDLKKQEPKRTKRRSAAHKLK
jgi:transcriptional regulator with XRE-family HTH domain